MEKRASEIDELNIKFSISIIFVYRTIDHFSQKSTVDNRMISGRPRMVLIRYDLHTKVYRR